MLRKSVKSSEKSVESFMLGPFTFIEVLDNLKENPTLVDLSDTNLNKCSTKQWETLGDGLNRCVALDTLILGNNKIMESSRDQYQAACASIAQAQSVRVLDFSANFSSRHNSDMHNAVGRLLKALSKLTEFYFRHSNLGAITNMTPDHKKVWKNICDMFTQSKTLESVDLRYNKLYKVSDEKFEQLVNTILKTKNIFSVKISDYEKEKDSNNTSSFSEKKKSLLAKLNDELENRRKKQPLDEKQIESLILKLNEQEQVIFEQMQTVSRINQKNIEELSADVAKLQFEKPKIKLKAHLNMSEQQRVESVLKAYPNCWAYYRLLHIKLEEIFIGCKAAASNIVPNKVGGKIGKLAKGTDFVGGLLSFLPIIGSAVKTTAEVVSGQFKKIDDKRILTLLQSISALGTLSEISSISELCARSITFSYATQLHDLKTLPEIEDDLEKSKSCSLVKFLNQATKKIYEKANEFTTGKRAQDHANVLAEYTILQIFSALITEKIDLTKPFHLEIIRALSTPKSSLKKNAIKASKMVNDPIQFIITLLRDKTMLTRSGKEWVLEDILVKPGLRTKDGCFTCDDLDADNYGYRWASEEDNVKELTLVGKPKYLSEGTREQLLRSFSNQGLFKGAASSQENNNNLVVLQKK